MYATAVSIIIAGPLSANMVSSLSPPADPLPPVANIHGYKYGANSPGRSGPSRRPKSHSTKHQSSESDATGPRDCQELSEYVQVVCAPEPEGSKPPKVSPAQLAMTNWAQMPIPAPRVRTAPPRRSAGLVGLPEWFWVTNWRTITSRATARDVWVEVSARPQSMTIDPGNGSPVRCTGPGTAYDKSRPASMQRTDCSYTFQRSSAHQPGGAYRVRVSVLWGGTWRGSDGSGGALPPLTRSTSFRLRVAEAQGLYG